MSDARASNYRKIFYGLFYPAPRAGASAATSTVVSDLAFQSALGAVRQAIQEDDQKIHGQKAYGAHYGAN
jgi:hypothetical protein